MIFFITIYIDQSDSYSVDSITPSGIAFEVGPLVHGTVSSAVLETTRSLVLNALEYFDSLAAHDKIAAKLSIVPNSFPELEYFEYVTSVKYPPTDESQLYKVFICIQDIQYIYNIYSINHRSGAYILPWRDKIGCSSKMVNQSSCLQVEVVKSLLSKSKITLH